jgi:hypothetical protein
MAQCTGTWRLCRRGTDIIGSIHKQTGEALLWLRIDCEIPVRAATPATCSSAYYVAFCYSYVFGSVHVAMHVCFVCVAGL